MLQRVASLNNDDWELWLCRQWLKSYSEAGAAKSAAFASSDALHNALQQTGIVTRVQQVYVQTKVASGGQADALRGVILRLLTDKANVRRGDVMETARAEDIIVSDGTYQKVMKDLCTSHGNLWSLKSGA